MPPPLVSALSRSWRLVAVVCEKLCDSFSTVQIVFAGGADVRDGAAKLRSLLLKAASFSEDSS